MDFLPKDIENIILDYKFQLEYVDKYEKTIKLIDDNICPFKYLFKMKYAFITKKY